MTALGQRRLAGTKVAFNSGQGALEFVIIAIPVMIVLLAVIDFGRALNYMQTMVGLSREGSNIASRGATPAAAAAAIVAGDAPLDIENSGDVIITAVSKVNNANVITGQAAKGGISCVSKIGTGVGSSATMPPSADAMLQSGETIYVTEVFYAYKPITPIGNLMTIIMPSTLYESAFF
jgi:Flp pilus assembly protein TadG